MCSLVNGKVEYKNGSRDTINGILGYKNKKGKRIRNDETELIDQNIVDE